VPRVGKLVLAKEVVVVYSGHSAQEFERHDEKDDSKAGSSKDPIRGYVP